MRESAVGKARRYVAEGRLIARSVDATGAQAECRGDGAIYRVSFKNGAGSATAPPGAAAPTSTRSGS